jgi:hypothetical protein
MARISTHTWNEIQKDFESGMSQADIRKKYDISPSTLGSKIKRDGWRLSQDQKAILSEFKEVSAKISESHSQANDLQKKEIEDEFKTILEDNELIQNNRKLLKMAQGIIIKNKEKFDHSNIRNLTGAVKDIESVANPQASKIEANSTNNNQTVNEIVISEA